MASDNTEDIRPTVAIIDGNTLAAIGLKTILQRVMPLMDIDILGSFKEFEGTTFDRYAHFFVSVNIVVAHRQFFMNFVRKTIVLTTTSDSLPGFHSINVNVSESQLVKSVLLLENHAHANGRNLPQQTIDSSPSILSNREIEVLVLIVKGYINKEIADRLNISVTTVISHRKNIMEKLEAKSVSALTIYAVTRGFVDIASI